MAEKEVTDLGQRLDDAIDQLKRYGSLYSSEVADLLDAVTDLNDDLHHARHRIVRDEAAERISMCARIAAEDA
jgi:hypothetical protein